MTIATGAVLFLGASLLVLGIVGLVVLVSGWADLRRAARVRRTPEVSLSQIPASGVVKVRGTAQPSELGTMPAKLCGRDAVCVQETLSGYSTGSSGRPHWTDSSGTTDLRDFWLVDETTGQAVRIRPQGAWLVIDRTTVQTDAGGVPRVRRLREKYGAARVYVGSGGARSWRQEQAILPGDRVIAVGSCSWYPAPMLGNSAVSKQVAWLHQGQDELLLSNLPEAELYRALRRRVLRGTVLLGLTGLGFVGLAGWIYVAWSG